MIDFISAILNITHAIIKYAEEFVKLINSKLSLLKPIIIEKLMINGVITFISVVKGISGHNESNYIPFSTTIFNFFIGDF